MFATKTNAANTRTQLQQALDNDSAKTQPQEFALDTCGLEFEPQLDPTAPIFRRSTTSKKLFQVDLFAGWTRA